MGNDDRLIVRPEVVKSMGGDLTSAVGDFTAGARTFDAGIQALVSIAKGRGSTSIDRLAQEWTRAHGQILSALDDLGIHTQEAADLYDQGRSDQAEQTRARGNQMNFHPETLT